MNAALAAMTAKMDKDPCLRRERDVYVQRAWAECIELLPPRRMTGVWVYGLEESSFIPGELRVPKASNRLRFRIFLEADQRLSDRLAENIQRQGFPASFAVDFIGRRSKHAGRYYTGDGDHVVVLDRLISARYIGVAPAPDWVAALKAGKKPQLPTDPLSETIWE